MSNIKLVPKYSFSMLEIAPDVARQYIDAVAVFEALEDATRVAAQTRGGMYWHAGGISNPAEKYLIRTSPSGVEKSLGPRTPKLMAIYEKFIQKKQENTERVRHLKAALEKQQRLNRAQRVGRVDPLVIQVLNRLTSTQLSEHFLVVGTHAMYAYEAAAGVRVDSEAVATRDIDLLWDTRKRLMFSTQLAKIDRSMLNVLRKVHASFRLRSGQKYTAVNQDGFEIDIIRREQAQDDPHPIKLNAIQAQNDIEDFWVAQARRAHVLMDGPSYSAVVVATNGAMARMHTVHPKTFVSFKQWMSKQKDREPLKRRRDALQAQTVATMIEKYF